MKDLSHIEIQEYFNKNGYVVIKGFLDQNTATLFYSYCINKVKKIDFKMMFAKDDYRSEWDGQFGDEQSPMSYSCYADDLMDTLLELSVPTIEKYVGLELSPTYSYWRFYQKDEVLERHRDRPSCEISATLCLGYNISNLSEGADSWPMFVEDKDNPTVGLPIYLEPGDIIIYKGCEVDHWREKYEGLNHAQVFLHLNDQNGPYKNLYDGRPLLCVPKKYQVKF
jgi:hypothetical protein